MIGAIADDFTGATDLASSFVRSGFRTVVITDTADLNLLPPLRFDAAIVALKSRTAPVEDAVRDSLAALEGLLSLGATTIYFKYCSTFDSTDEGNVGPVLDALMARLAVDRTIAVPALPVNGRTVYQGHLFVHDQLLSDSPMKDHPLTPMRDSNVASLLRRQSGSEIRLISWQQVQHGSDAIASALARDQSEATIYIVDAISDADLATIAKGSAELKLVSGGSGLALGMRGPHPTSSESALATAHNGGRVILAGSASSATRAQVAHASRRLPHCHIDLFALRQDAHSEVERIVSWVKRQIWDLPERPVLVYAVDEDDELDAGNPEHARSAVLIEEFFASAALRLVDGGVRHLFVAGGETSGAVVSALGISILQFGREISPGVAWVSGKDAQRNHLNLALKSGNFGTDDVFTSAWEVLV